MSTTVGLGLFALVAVVGAYYLEKRQKRARRQAGHEELLREARIHERKAEREEAGPLHDYHRRVASNLRITAEEYYGGEE